jgi:hypothetical protein
MENISLETCCIVRDRHTQDNSRTDESASSKLECRVGIRHDSISGWIRAVLPIKREKSVANDSFLSADAIPPTLQTRFGKTIDSMTSAVNWAEKEDDTSFEGPHC